ncbi:hypothetical protein A4A49_14090 [Nicotiana attenuata]|uniref:Uncharacterized protein n=1 Tax=Nicotiana attenuata TaxID=49451 RepID=A0A314L145_NICAT|nr:hypothetical protein A4A49_14090 [Nicotiana attenuata]
MDGNVDGKDKNKRKEQVFKGTSKDQQQERKKNGRDQSPNPTLNGIGGGDSSKSTGKEGGNSSLNKEEFDLRKVEKEAVENAIKEREAALIPVDTRTDVETRKENTIYWVHRRFGTNKKELRQCNVTTNKSWQDIPSQTHEDSGHIDELNEVIGDNAKKITSQTQKTGITEDATVNPSSSKTRVEENLNSVMDQDGKQIGDGKGASREAGNLCRPDQTAQSKIEGDGTVTSDKAGLKKGPNEDVLMKVIDETMRLEQQTGRGKKGESNGTVIPVQATTVNPRLGNVYGMQFKLIQAAITTIEQA